MSSGVVSATNQDDLFLVLAVFSRFVSGEVRSRRQAAPGEAGRPLAMTWRPSGPQRRSCGCSRVSSCLGSTLQHGFFFGQHAFVHQVNSDLQRSRSGTLAVTGLQHVQLAVAQWCTPCPACRGSAFPACWRWSTNCSYTSGICSCSWEMGWGYGYRPRRPRPERSAGTRRTASFRRWRGCG